MTRQNVILLGILFMFLGLFTFASPTLAATKALTDLAITDAVKDEMLLDPGVVPEIIDVETSDGIVILSGTVDNLLAKERAERIAETVKGVRAVVNNLKVVPPLQRSDREIRSDVREALLHDPATESYEVGVAVVNGEVRLSGMVDSYQEKKLVEKVAMGVRGVTAVSNNIAVIYRADRPDREIEEEIEQRLKWDTLIDHVLIGVEVNDGVVSLTGVVGSAAEKRRARYDAWVTGVKSVNVSGLEVKRWARDPDLRTDKYETKSDDEIRKAVQDALLYDPRVFTFNVNPEVSDGIVTLRGEVNNLKAKRAAAQDARNTVGVSVVINRLKVKLVDPMEDEKIERRIDAALTRDPYVEGNEIDARVTNRIAYLYGTVDSYFDKALAEDAASRVKGVATVKNYLLVRSVGEGLIYDPYVDSWYSHDYNWYLRHPSAVTLKSDAKLKVDIRDELYWSPFVDMDDVKISVQNGVATLSGKVDSWSERWAAEENAYDAGARLVRNELKVK
jgi:osmotically-inducible protein OsmY